MIKYITAEKCFCLKDICIFEKQQNYADGEQLQKTKGGQFCSILVMKKEEYSSSYKGAHKISNC